MTNGKFTKKDYFMAIVNLCNLLEAADPSVKEQVATSIGFDELSDFAERELTLLANKSKKASEKPTKTQQENIEFMAIILEALASCEEAVTITELQTKNDTLSELSNQRVSALMKKLVDDNKVVKIISKRRSYFALA